MGVGKDFTINLRLSTLFFFVDARLRASQKCAVGKRSSSNTVYSSKFAICSFCSIFSCLLETYVSRLFVLLSPIIYS